MASGRNEKIAAPLGSSAGHFRAPHLPCHRESHHAIIGLADELGGVRRGGMRVDLARRGDLLSAPPRSRAMRSESAMASS